MYWRSNLFNLLLIGGYRADQLRPVRSPARSQNSIAGPDRLRLIAADILPHRAAKITRWEGGYCLVDLSGHAGSYNIVPRLNQAVAKQ